MPMKALDIARLDRSHFAVASLSDESDEKNFWKARTPQERLEALEYLRRVMYGDDAASSRLQRVLGVAALA